MIREESGELIQGTLEMLILKALARRPLHGYAVAEWIEQTSQQVLKVEEGALYPALHRLQLRGLLSAEWGAERIVRLRPAFLHAQHSQLFRIRHRERTQKEPVDQRENCGVGPHAQRQR